MTSFQLIYFTNFVKGILEVKFRNLVNTNVMVKWLQLVAHAQGILVNRRYNLYNCMLDNSS